MNRENRRVLKHAAKLLRRDACMLRDSHQEVDGTIDSISVQREIDDFLSTANHLRKIASAK